MSAFEIFLIGLTAGIVAGSLQSLCLSIYVRSQLKKEKPPGLSRLEDRISDSFQVLEHKGKELIRLLETAKIWNEMKMISEYEDTIKQYDAEKIEYEKLSKESRALFDEAKKICEGFRRKIAECNSHG